MIKELLKRDVSRQFIRFCLVGAESTILYYLIFILALYFLSINYTISFAAGFVAGTFFGFIFNKVWTFESERNPSREIGQYFLIYLISFGIGFFSIKFLVDNLGLLPIIANLPTLAITTLINFFGTKIFAFRNKKW